MADDFDYCETLVREADKDRFVAALFAPAPAVSASGLELLQAATSTSDITASNVAVQVLGRIPAPRNYDDA